MGLLDSDRFETSVIAGAGIGVGMPLMIISSILWTGIVVKHGEAGDGLAVPGG